MKSEKVKFNLYFLIVLSSLIFYNPFGIIPPQYGKLLFYLICFISLIYAYKNGINLRKIKYPKVAYKILISGIIFSSFMASFFHEQSFMTSFIAIIPYILGFLVFYILMKFNLPKEKIEKAIWTFCIISMITYIINFVSIPNTIFGMTRETFDDSRGVVRLSIFSLELIVLYFLYAINKWMQTRQKKHLYLIVITGLFIVLSVIRQYIFLSIMLGILFILQKSSFIKKIIFVAICLCVYYFILPKIPMYQKMSEVTSSQIDNNAETEDIRISAWKFYTNEYQTNSITRILGNGLPSIGNSKWGNNFEKTISRDYGGNGCFFVDVGWAGFYWLFGVFSTIGLIIILIKAILKKKSVDKQYLSYWCLFIVLTSIASAPILFYNQITSISTVLYLIYGKENNCNNNIKLQQL